MCRFQGNSLKEGGNSIKTLKNAGKDKKTSKDDYRGGMARRFEYPELNSRYLLNRRDIRKKNAKIRER